ncbi:DUF6155 family protein [Flavobacterium wongokense]|uniref:DUF6155 family protein n=1 Tax=Flavobacterium wongokense TaxID=2910674 RepID=UPI001F2FD6C4|nr:DUF6155 family protein [Flavobacterium sp. WG47]MCF6132102.1 DUF6155 family protein [Flavobacterium sp. WG47]
MSKRDLKKYLKELSKEQLEEQLFELYEKFRDVKVYYDFAFNPNEEKLIGEAKVKIANEYFPMKGRKAKMRRSIAQKFIKHFISLGVDVTLVADLMLFTIETAQRFSSKRYIKYESFFKSLFTAYQQALNFMIENGIINEFLDRVVEIKEEANRQNWVNKYDFNELLEKFDDNFL